jgi:putative nucleotidyltransferase with HDIG domain
MSATVSRDVLVRRLAAATRALALYARGHPLVDRSVSALFDACAAWLQEAPSLVIGFLDSEIIVDSAPVRQAGGTLTGLARTLTRRDIEKISFFRGLSREELRAALEIVAGRNGADHEAHDAVASRLGAAGVRHVTVGTLTLEDTEHQPPGIQAAIRVYDSAMRTAESFWQTARAGQPPDTMSARKVINSLAQVVTDDRPSLMALTTLKRHDAYTFTHMVNVSIVTMAVARALGVEPGLVREFGLAALMHDIGKTQTPLDILNKPGRLAQDEMAIIKRHVVDGAGLLWRLPDMPPLAAIVAFEHHLRQDRTGYPEGAKPRRLNLCTMIVSIADVFDALRTNRPYRKALATDRVRTMLAEQNGTAFHPALLKRFITVVGLFPVGTLVRLDTGEVGIVTHEHPEDAFRPQVKVVLDPAGHRLDEPYLVNTWERDARGECAPAVTEAVDAEEVGLDPLTLL